MIPDCSALRTPAILGIMKFHAKGGSAMSQVLPRYYFSGEYADLYPKLLTLPHREMHVQSGDLLWKIGEPVTKNYYFLSGLAQCYVEHEDGHRKNLSFHGAGTIFPGVQKADYKIEKSILLKALTKVEAVAFDREDFYSLCLEYPPLMARLCEVQSAYINMLIYDSAHQRYNDTFLKVCNFLFLMANSDNWDKHVLSISQETIADTLGVGRNHVTQSLSRLRQEGILRLRRCHIEIVDLGRLASYCSLETIKQPLR